MADTRFGFDYSALKAYSGHYTNRETLRESASGGAANVLAEIVLEHGGVVFGVSYAPDFRSAEYYCVEKKEDLSLLKGSKYIFSAPQVSCKGKPELTYRLVERKLREGKWVLFTGLGCIVQALYVFLSKRGADISNLFTADLICMGPTSPKVHAAYIDDLEKKYHSRVRALSMRYKKKGWTPPYIRTEFENGAVHETSFYDSDYGYAFQFYARPCCYQCLYKGDGHRADLTLGDDWGIPKTDPAYDADGVSVIIARTERGRKLLSEIDPDKFFLKEADLRRVLEHNPMYYKSREKSLEWEKFQRCLHSDSFRLHNAVIRARGRYYRARLLLARILPKSVRNFIKRRILRRP